MAKVAAKKVVKRRRERKNIEKGAVHISATFNNLLTYVHWTHSPLSQFSS